MPRATMGGLLCTTYVCAQSQILRLVRFARALCQESRQTLVHCLRGYDGAAYPHSLHCLHGRVRVRACVCACVWSYLYLSIVLLHITMLLISLARI